MTKFVLVEGFLTVLVIGFAKREVIAVVSGLQQHHSAKHVALWSSNLLSQLGCFSWRPFVLDLTNSEKELNDKNVLPQQWQSFNIKNFHHFLRLPLVCCEARKQWGELSFLDSFSVGRNHLTVFPLCSRQEAAWKSDGDFQWWRWLGKPWYGEMSGWAN